MNLPNLPKTNNQLESKFGLALRKWVEANPRFTSTFETKDTRGESSLPFSKVKDAQITFGKRVKSDKGVFIRLYPFYEGIADYAFFRRSPAYIVVKFPKQFSLIDVEQFEHESNISKRRSLTAARAEEISIITVKNATK